MGIIDIVFLAALVIGLISGLQKGFLTSVLACAAMFGAFLIAGALEGRLAEAFMNTSLRSWLEANLEAAPEVWSNLFHVLSYVVVFFLAYAALMLIVNLINNMFRVPKLRGVDGLLGGLLGLVRAYVIICLAVAALKIVLGPLEGGEFVLKLLEESALGRFFTSDSALADLFGIGARLAKLG
ncbi:MAG: CvpA family protein [Clostridia bacterium]|nr:CvpA family protein [Clostridia bacterium]